MVKKIIYLETAIDDLASIHRYIAQDSVRYAKLEVQKIKSFCRGLIEHPHRGRLYRTQRQKEIRSAIFRNYIIFYITEENRIVILSVHHQSRDISNNPALNDDE